MKARHLNSSFIPESQLILNDDGSVYHLGVTGDQVADTVLIVGDPDRVPIILNVSTPLSSKSLVENSVFILVELEKRE